MRRGEEATKLPHPLREVAPSVTAVVQAPPGPAPEHLDPPPILVAEHRNGGAASDLPRLDQDLLHTVSGQVQVVEVYPVLVRLGRRREGVGEGRSIGPAVLPVGD